MADQPHRWGGIRDYASNAISNQPRTGAVFDRWIRHLSHCSIRGFFFALEGGAKMKNVGLEQVIKLMEKCRQNHRFATITIKVRHHEYVHCSTAAEESTPIKNVISHGGIKWTKKHEKRNSKNNEKSDASSKFHETGQR